MNHNEFEAFIAKQKWIFAKTYAEFAPHEYVVKGKGNSNEEFMEAVNFIIENGIRMFYYKTERKYIFMGGKFYWMCCNQNGEPIVINRCEPDDYDIVFMKRGTQERKR